MHFPSLNSKIALRLGMSKAQTREMKLFENFVHSPHTIFGYKNQIKAFVKWAKFPNWEHMLSLDSKELKIILEDYVMEKRRTCRAITVRGCTFAIQAFLDAKDYDSLEHIITKSIRSLSHIKTSMTLNIITEQEE